MKAEREVWVDWLRIAACAMVMLVHSTEPFYLGGEGGSQVLSRADAWWCAIIDSLVRCCVPLFIVASSYLQFPIHYAAGEFIRRRALRILPPFVLWSVFYAFWWGDPVENFRDLLLNFNYAAGHLWFVYMLLGLYLLMPLLSPWAEKVGKKELRGWIGLWLVTTLLPLVRDLAAGGVTMIEGPSGIPQVARYPLWGEASWNAYGTFYYISGVAGYLLLGLYFRKFAPEGWSRRKTLCVALPCFFGGFAITAGDFLRRVFADSVGVFPYGATLDRAVGWETMWCYDSIGVALMTIGALLLFRRIHASGAFYRHIVLPISKASYGMYLMHLAHLAWFAATFRSLLYDPAAPFGWTTAAVIFSTALATFLSTALLSILLQRIPKLGRWIIG